ncbi:nucleotide-diphospho-sugar transferase [Mycena rosella]|uniref:Nucleotide-diphospho-sugar transferase n=1 Tax=Mycena rosella TaxID=1033263 RepID=A0AAD7GAV6_MYCRO|nr:nucleotide-diphospho-sugar transferase [Mycena rosella]
MQDENEVYGFTLSFLEYEAAIPTLWNAVKVEFLFLPARHRYLPRLEFTNSNPGLLPPSNVMDFLSDDGGETCNRCHFWSSFEIGDLDFWRGEAYSKFLDEKGGFYYEVPVFLFSPLSQLSVN